MVMKTNTGCQGSRSPHASAAPNQRPARKWALGNWRIERVAKLQIKAMTMIADALAEAGDDSAEHWSLAQEIEDEIYRA
jgi:hypothetical protein